MNCWKLVRTLSVLTAVGGLSTAAWGQTAPAKDVDAAQLESNATVLSARITEPMRISANGVINPSPRGLPACSGGTQTNDLTNGLNISAANVADNFSVGTAGSLSSVRFSVIYANGALPGTVPGTASFNIRILNDNAGLPGSVVSNQTVSGLVPVANGQVFGANNIPLQNFTAAISPVALGVGCFWLEIRQTSTNAAGVATFWMTSADGDSVSYQNGGNVGTSTYSDCDQSAGDLAWCFDLATAPITCPIVSPQPGCSLAAGNALPYDNSTGAGRSSWTGAGSFLTANNFSTPASASTITQLCWWGFYNAQSVAPASETFRIRIYDTLNFAPGNIVAERNVGTGTSFPLRRCEESAFLNVYTYSVSFTGADVINLNASTCYWLEVAGTNTTSANTRFIWMLTQSDLGTTGGNANVGDQFFAQRPNANTGYTAGNLLVTTANTPAEPVEPAFNLSFVAGPGITSQCANLPVQANGTCGTATALTLNAPAVFGNNIRVTGQTQAPPCGFNMAESNPTFANTVWYTVSSATSQNITVTTCATGSNPFGTNTTFDTVLNVYCSSAGCTGPFFCVANNDTADPDCTTDAADADASTVTFTAVAGQTYYVVLSGYLLDSGFYFIGASAAAPTTTAAACATLAPCSLNVAPATVTEADASCGAAQTNALCSGAVNLPFGGIGRGFVDTPANNSRDFDLWRLPVLGAATWLDITLQAEFPGLVAFYTGECPDPLTRPTFAGAVVTSIGPPVTPGCAPVTVQVLYPAGQNYFNITANAFAGLTCATNNDYLVSVAPSALEACCIAGVCSITVPDDCTVQGGVAQGPGSVCTPDPCNANPCPLDLSGNNFVDADDIFAFLNIWFAGPPGANCVAPPTGCPGDWNNDGLITADDIFAFLNDWFAFGPGQPCP